MRTHSFHSIAVLLLLMLGIAVSVATAQERIVKITSGQGTIEAALTADAATRTANTVYELERWGYYEVKTTIANSGYHLRFRAAADTGRKPIVRPYAGTTRSFAPAGDLTLEGIYLNSVDGAGTLKQNNIRTGAANIKVTLIDCHLDRDLQALLRIESAWTKWIIKRCYISNLGLMADNNGRAWDDRGNNVDTVIMEDNVFYNLTGRMTRDGGGVINYFRFNHNTCVNVFNQPFALGEFKEAYVTNNLMVNTGFSGDDSSNSYQVNILRYRGDTVGGTPQVLRVRNNNFHMTPGLVAGFPTGPRGQVRALNLFDSLTIVFMKQYGDSASNKTTSVVFTNGPRDEVGPLQDYWNAAVPAGSKRNMYAGPDSGKGEWGAIHMPWNFAYPTSSSLYSGGTDGLPVGAVFVHGLTVGVNETPGARLPQGIELLQNYPNPFNPATLVTYELPGTSTVSVKVYDALGREVATLASGIQSAGRHTVTFDGRGMTSGMYIVRLLAGVDAREIRMMLVK